MLEWFNPGDLILIAWLILHNKYEIVATNFYVRSIQTFYESYYPQIELIECIQHFLGGLDCRYGLV